jgi:hypothetical protein
VFLTGMRFNKPLRVHKRWPVAAMSAVGFDTEQEFG